LKKVRAEKMLLEFAAQPLTHALQGNTGGVRGDDGTRLSHRFDPFEQVLFDLQVLDHHFHNPVAIRQLIEIVFQIADAYQVGIFGLHEQAMAGT
jgi:hypothetical protein